MVQLVARFLSRARLERCIQRVGRKIDKLVAKQRKLAEVLDKKG